MYKTFTAASSELLRQFEIDDTDMIENIRKRILGYNIALITTN